MNAQMNRHFFSDENKLWISFDASSINSTDFKSSTGLKYPQKDDVSLDFVYKFFQRFAPRSIGMDLTEVNFELTKGATRHNDEQTFRELFELVVHEINQPVINDDFTFK